ncbi:hypothetical protein MUU53_08430 [Rhizobium lemnae]|uniref:Uncharacterized protein n=1 Tax=Rhizobium lemnae TaxID=1214924 RepID=A0ABV8E4D3_9HYPH|nr:hypothetical protein [Rhizobium lemnae]MCJ8507941.1 hypothetical protein [Rhizobium lemnae]
MGPFIVSFNIPYICDFFFSSDDVTSSRPGRFFDAMWIAGGVMLWRGHKHLIIELHLLRTMHAMFLRHSKPVSDTLATR